MIRQELPKRVGRALYARAWLFQLCAYPADIRRKRPKGLIQFVVLCPKFPHIAETYVPPYRLDVGDLRNGIFVNPH